MKKLLILSLLSAGVQLLAMETEQLSIAIELAKPTHEQVLPENFDHVISSFCGKFKIERETAESIFNKTLTALSPEQRSRYLEHADTILNDNSEVSRTQEMLISILKRSEQERQEQEIQEKTKLETDLKNFQTELKRKNRSKTTDGIFLGIVPTTISFATLLGLTLGVFTSPTLIHDATQYICSEDFYDVWCWDYVTP